MNPANYREALVEAQADESEGADILLVSIAVFVADWIIFMSEPPFMLKFSVLGSQVKPGLPYLDVIRLLRDKYPLPIAAYQVLFYLAWAYLISVLFILEFIHTIFMLRTGIPLDKNDSYWSIFWTTIQRYFFQLLTEQKYIVLLQFPPTSLWLCYLHGTRYLVNTQWSRLVVLSKWLMSRGLWWSPWCAFDGLVLISSSHILLYKLLDVYVVRRGENCQSNKALLVLIKLWKPYPF